MAKTIRSLSRTARKMLDRIHAGHFYKWTDEPGPVMQELLDAGFVESSGRVVVVERFFVPKGFRSVSHEKYPAWTCAHLEYRAHEQVTADGEYTESWDQCRACGFQLNYKATAIPKKIDLTPENPAPIRKAFNFGALVK